MKNKLSVFLFLCFSVSFLNAQNLIEIERVIDIFFGNITITKNDNIIFEKSYGYADAIHHTKLTYKNSFQVASISKQFTAYGIMMLHNKGLLNYDSMVVKYLPSFPYNNISIRHLLQHTSGLPNFWDQIRPDLDTTKSNGNKDVLAYLIAHQMSLQNEPGAKFIYADIGYDFLAMVIEAVSGLSYQDFMQINIFGPLKMKSTFAYMVTDIQRIKNNHLAIGHAFQNGTFIYGHLQPKYHFVYYLGDFYGDGSVVTTARDLATWTKALHSCKLLPCDIQNESLVETKYNGQIVNVRQNSSISYGFGWFIKNTDSGKLAYHTGGHPGNVHAIYRFINKDINFIFLSNAETGNLKELRNRILELLQ